MIALRLLVLLLPFGCAPTPVPPPDVVFNPSTAPTSAPLATLDVLRPFPGASKIYVQAGLPDGSRGIFLVDTGAAISVLSTETADRLGLETTGSLRIEGLSGAAETREAKLPWVDLGGFVVPDIGVAVGVPGLPEYAGWMPIDGILGNNVWAGNVLAIDYPADILRIGKAGQIAVPDNAEPMAFDGTHVMVRATLHAGSSAEDEVVRSLLLELDTGTHGVLLSGPIDDTFAAKSREAEEPILGLGAADLMPVSAFYRKTRHVPLWSMEFGGQTLTPEEPATWMNYGSDRAGPQDLVGLIGHTAVEDHELFLDYAGGRFALAPSSHPARSVDGHAVLLEQELRDHGESADRALFRARCRLALEDWEGAERDLDMRLAAEPTDGAAQVLRARLALLEGDIPGYLDRIQHISPALLVDEGDIVGSVNGLIMDGKAAEGLVLARRAIAERPREPEPYIALADALVAIKDLVGARAALTDAGKLAQNPDANLKRRARIALAEGDGYGALAHLRKELSLYPSDGEALWFYAQLVTDPGLLPGDRKPLIDTFRADMNRAMARLHDDALPLDFYAASSALIGEPKDRVDALIAQGFARDCEPITDEAALQNCTAWYRAMGGQADEEALRLVRASLLAPGPRSPRLDTLAVILAMRGEWTEALAVATDAARQAPDRIYHVWQAERIARLATFARKQ